MGIITMGSNGEAVHLSREEKITVTREARSALDEAGWFVGRMPTDKAGLLFLKGGRVVQPDPDRLSEYQTHDGRRRGHWPTSAGILSAMLERYNKPPNPEEGI